MLTLIIDPEAGDEIDAIFESDEPAGALIYALLEALEGDQAMLERLFRPGNHFDYEPPFEVKPFGEAQRLGKNIFTMKIRDEEGALLPYRVLLAHHAQIDTYYVLSAASRGDVYDPGRSGFRDVLDRYDRHGIPTYRY